MIAAVRAFLIVVAGSALVVGSSVAGNPGQKMYTAGDLQVVLGAKPPAGAGACRVTDSFFGRKAAFNLRDLPATMRAPLSRAGFQNGYNRVWSCSAVGDAASFAFLFRSGQGAAAAVPPLKSLQPCVRQIA